MISIQSNKWLIYFALLVAILLVLPYFGFLFRSHEVEPKAPSRHTQNTSNKSLSSIDELLEKQSVK